MPNFGCCCATLHRFLNQIIYPVLSSGVQYTEILYWSSMKLIQGLYQQNRYNSNIFFLNYSEFKEVF